MLVRRSILRDEERRAQADWLAESALARASARLAVDPGYVGETWRIEPAELLDVGAADVSIAIGPVENEPRRRRVRVEAECPPGRRPCRPEHQTPDRRPWT